MVVFKRLADHLFSGAYLSGRLVIAERGAAVIDGGKAEPLQCFGVSDHTEVVEMPVFVGR